MRSPLGLLAPLLFAGTVAPAGAADRLPRERVLRVTGEGKARAAPDVAVATFGVTTVAATLSAATQEADATMKAIVGSLARAGVQGRDVQTTRHDVAVERRVDKAGNPGPVSAFRVAGEVRATMRDLSRVGPILDAVVKAGANEVHALTFEKDDPAPEYSRARAAAVADARAKAVEIARAAGVTLGEILELAEGGRGQPPGPMMMREAAYAGGGPPVEPGQLEFGVTVDVVYAIQ